jgi:hypothetical protein
LILCPWFFLHKSGKAVEIVGPEALVAVQPSQRLLHRFRGQPAGDHAAGLFARDEPCIRQHVEVLHDGGERHRKRLRQFADRDGVAGGKPRQQRAPRRVGERGKGAVQIALPRAAVILNHVV